MLDNRIYTFLAVCQEMNFTRAAKSCISHSLLSPSTFSILNGITAFMRFASREKSFLSLRRESFSALLF